MNDLLFGNTNEKTVKRIANRLFLKEQKRNRIIISSIILTTLLIVSLFGIGSSIEKTIQQQEIRMRGTKAQTVVVNPTNEDVTLLRSDENIKASGTTYEMGNAYIKENADINMIFLYWADDLAWKEMISPAFSEMYGSYPMNDNEIFVPDWLLSKLGIENPKIGMDIELDYRYGSDTVANPALSELETKVFCLSGWYHSDQYDRALSNATCYISKAFWEHSVANESNTRRVEMLLYESDEDAITDYSNLLTVIKEGSDHHVNLMITDGAIGAGSTYAALFGIIMLILLCGYLLIYNVFYISIRKDIRFFGQLKTLGTTKRQIRSIIFRQLRRLCGIGIPIGLFLGAIISLWIVPVGVKALYNGTETVSVSFRPIVFVAAAILAFVTTLIGGLRPAKIAGRVTPVEALRFLEVSYIGKKTIAKKTFSVFHIAWRNIFRNRKGAFLTFLSLFLGVTVYLVVSGILSSIDVSYMTAEHFGSGEDISIQLVGGYAGEGYSIQDDKVEAIHDIPGVEQVITYHLFNDDNNDVYISNENGEWSAYLQKIYKSNPQFRDYEDSYREGNLYSSDIIGIEKTDFLLLEKSMKINLDYDAFSKGKLVFLNVIDNELENLELPDKLKYTIGGELFSTDTIPVPIGSQPLHFTDLLSPGTPVPSIILSQEYLEQCGFSNDLVKIKVTVKKGAEMSVSSNIKQIFSNNAGVIVRSRYEVNQEFKRTLSNLYMLGISLAVLLLFIGVMNFINTVSVSVTVRKKELAMLESIGMTRRQIKNMLLMEGVYYWMITLLLVATLGSILLVIVYKVVKSQVIPYLSFSYPIFPMIAAGTCILLVCIIVPLCVYYMEITDSVVDRL